MAKRRTLEQAIGGELRRLREGSGARQEAVAHAAQAFGLNWTQPTVAAIEGGRRSISLGEAGMLNSILAWSGVSRRPLRLLDFIPDTDEWVIVAPGHEAPLRSIRAWYGTYEEQEAAPGYQPRPPSGTRDTTITPPAGTLALAGTAPKVFITEAERKAARALKTTPARVTQTAHALWGHSLDEERDRRVGDPAASAQKRGRVTRTLTQQLRQRITRRRKADG
jgi:transcriptional regulator with XRE-family HTH domain